MGSEPLWKAVIVSPASCFAVALCIVVWLLLMNKGATYEVVGMSYQLIIRGKQFWRTVTASVSHIDLLHLVFNMSSLWSLRFLEVKFGAFWYFRVSFILMIASIFLTLGIYHILIKIGGGLEDQYANSLGLGYSCVVFGLMTVAYQTSGTNSISFFGLFSIPLSLAPFGSLLLTQLLVPRASFIGHLSGIIVGYLFSWGLFFWIDTQTFIALLFWSAVAFLWSLKTTSDFPLPFIKCIQPASFEGVRISRDGIIERQQQQRHGDLNELQ